jgi:opacity protein-like surface antigen
MIRDYISRRFVFSLGFALAVIASVFVARAVRAGQDTQQGQQQGQSDQGQGQGQSQEKQKKKGGFLSGVKAMTESSKEQTSATASAGTKGIGDQGTKVAEVTPTPADRQAVTQMESFTLPQGDLSKFIEAGHLQPKQ